MEPSELAIAALNEVKDTQSASHRRDPAGKIATSAFSINATTTTTTGIDMEASVAGNAIVNSNSTASKPPQRRPLIGNDGMQSAGAEGERREYQNNATLGMQSTSSDNDNSQSTIDAHDVATPPTTASEGLSSQGTNQDGPLSQLSQLSQLAAAQQPLTNPSATQSNPTIAPAAGHKRTADGQVKPVIPESPNSPLIRGHSRNASAISNLSTTSGRIGEISAELRTRLSYAMVKVNNGWQSNSIDEVESLASQAGSPTSSTSTLHGRRNLITSPRTAIASLQTQSSSLSTSSSSQTPIADFDLYTASGQPSRTYESFWREHPTTNPPPNRYPSHQLANSPPPPRSLAPPADIRPNSSSRRSGNSKFSKPPSMPNQASNSSLRSSTPRTPNRGEYRDNPAMRTPTQKTIQEQDAIETLLFMSSPGNSGNMAHAFPPRSQASPQESPLRAEFNMQPRAAQGKKVGFDVAATSGSTESSEAGGGGAEYRRAHMSGGNMRRREEAIDRMLEEMDGSSSDEEQVVLKYSSPRTSLAAGR
ncbi:Uncharacterized protein BP5553_09378 [Venustampulla echinocandica]|uniref:Uncharacterized protein n=1 Tax=Venustampulla echinocandica TaxID=2656787 RepID=A0A370TCL7_9HELO|nr:Uncharacterized protein BP5553_09378 [Venustampulla echinocandica]RDL31976.1 Uncharacterized protein BP5553_09378 [Venustampulla echinocandica]